MSIIKHELGLCYLQSNINTFFEDGNSMNFDLQQIFKIRDDALSEVKLTSCILITMKEHFHDPRDGELFVFLAYFLDHFLL